MSQIAPINWDSIISRQVQAGVCVLN